MINWSAVKLIGSPIDTSEYIQFKTDDSPNFIIGKLQSQDETAFVIQNPLMCCIFTEVDYDKGTSSQQFLAKHYMPFSKDDLVTFAKDRVHAASEPDATIVNYYIQYNHNYYHQFEKAVAELTKHIDPVKMKKLVTQLDDPANQAPPVVAAPNSFFVDIANNTSVN